MGAGVDRSGQGVTMAISPDAFAARLNELCAEMEAEILAAWQTFNGRLSVLLDAAADTPQQELRAIADLADARLTEMERRLVRAA